MMPKRRKAYSKTKTVKEVARERIGTPPASRPILDKTRRDKPKHKKSISGDD